MRGKYINVICLLTMAFLACGCAAYNATTGSMPLGIIADRANYTPLMSSTVGIGLTPEYPSSINNSTVSFLWHTDYGYFLSWESPDFKVTNNGQDAVTMDRKIYWSYSPEDMDKDKPPVHITLTMADKVSGKTLNATGIDITWENGHIARVVK